LQLQVDGINKELVIVAVAAWPRTENMVVIVAVAAQPRNVVVSETLRLSYEFVTLWLGRVN
jgi:hypothetical protein